MQLYVEKEVFGKKLSLVGPFESREDAERFILRAQQEDLRLRPRRHIDTMLARQENLLYRVLGEDAVKEWLDTT